MLNNNSFSDRLETAVRAKKSAVLVGLDPRFESLPPSCKGSFLDFCKGVIDVVAPLVPAVKPQVAFFEQHGAGGMAVLQMVVQYARQKGLLVILDGKRNDIGTTAAAYADGMLGEKSIWGGDAITVSPYLGDDSLTPFFETAADRGAGVFVLVKTSNPGGAMLQDLIAADGKSIYRHVAEYVQTASLKTLGAGQYGSIGAVVGATWPEQLAELRTLMPNVWFLVPGFGAQGGSAKDVAPAFDSEGLGAIVNNSRGIIFAHTQKRYADLDWQRAVEAATVEMIEQLNCVSH